MKRLWLIAVPMALAFLAGVLIVWDPTAPRFQRLPKAFLPPPADSVSIAYPHARPFAGGRTWIASRLGTNQTHFYLLDIEAKRVIGEMSRAAPLFSNAEGTAALCVQRNGIRPTLRQKLELLLESVFRGRFRASRPPARDMEVFWKVNLKSGSAVRLGERRTMPGFSISFIPSPSFRYAMSRGGGPTNTSTTFFCDLDKHRWWTQTSPDWPLGWWNDDNLLQRSSSGDFELLNIHTAAIQTLLPRDRLSWFYQESNIRLRGGPAVPSYWNGREFEFYMSENSVFEPSHFIRLRRPNATPELVTKNFEFETAGEFDESGTRYIFADRSVGLCCNGVTLRDLKAKTEKVLVPATSSSTISLPAFYRDSVIYLRSNELWRIDCTGSNNVCLFPTPASAR